MKSLEQLREEINKIDGDIIKKLAERECLAKKIGELKAKENKQIADTTREKQLMQYYETLCQEHQLDANFIKGLFKLIITHSKTLQLQ